MKETSFNWGKACGTAVKTGIIGLMGWGVIHLVQCSDREDTAKKQKEEQSQQLADLSALESSIATIESGKTSYTLEDADTLVITKNPLSYRYNFAAKLIVVAGPADDNQIRYPNIISFQQVADPESINAYRLIGCKVAAVIPGNLAKADLKNYSKENQLKIKSELTETARFADLYCK